MEQNRLSGLGAMSNFRNPLQHELLCMMSDALWVILHEFPIYKGIDDGVADSEEVQDGGNGLIEFHVRIIIDLIPEGDESIRSPADQKRQDDDQSLLQNARLVVPLLALLFLGSSR